MERIGKAAGPRGRMLTVLGFIVTLMFFRHPAARL